MTGDNSYDATIIVPASNEEGYIEACLDALVSQELIGGRLQIIIAANACTDATEEIARSYAARAEARNWDLICDSSPHPGKTGALNRAEKLARSGIRIYIDADVICDPLLVSRLIRFLSYPRATYATGRLEVAPARSWITRAYASFWTRLPYMRDGAPGAGLFAVNAEGRSRWGQFPEVISDDTFVRMCFSPSERVQVGASYSWPLPEGLANLVKVRRRQDEGVRQIVQAFPEMVRNEQKSSLGWVGTLQLASVVPLGFVVYALVKALVRLSPQPQGWARGR